MILIRYEYEFHPFHRITQRPIANQENILLGNWDRWVEIPSESRYTEMIYSSGDMCWNGPARSTRVILECGLHTVIQSMEEQKKCSYVMRVETPLACRDRQRDSKKATLRTHDLDQHSISYSGSSSKPDDLGHHKDL